MSKYKELAARIYEDMKMIGGSSGDDIELLESRLASFALEQRREVLARCIEIAERTQPLECDIENGYGCGCGAAIAHDIRALAEQEPGNTRKGE